MKVPPFSLNKQLSDLGPALSKAVERVLLGGQYIGGKEVTLFEESFAETLRVPYSVGCNSGTDALVLALRALDIGPGDEVITSSFSFFATAEAISAVGAKPVFVEVDENNYLINIDSIKSLITSETKAILPVHLFGCPVDMDKLMELARENNLKVIEDCAQASGSKWKDRFLGSFGDVGCFSFFPTKNLGAAGDAGAIVTGDPKLAQCIRELSIHGMPKRYLHTSLGYNSRLDAIQAAVLNVKLPKLSFWVSRRNEIALRYKELLGDLSGIKLPDFNINSNSQHAWNQYVIRVIDLPRSNVESSLSSINSDKDELFKFNPRDVFQEKLKNKGINTIIYYPIPIHLQPAYKHLGYTSGSLPITEKLCDQVLSLPIFPELSFDEQKYVAECIGNILN